MQSPPVSQLSPKDMPVPAIWGEAAINSPLDVIVFSKDRACQLDALLRSTREFFCFPHRLHILYTTSSREFEQGYDLLRRWHPGVTWVQDQGQFRVAMDKLTARIERGPGRYLMFLVDDMMFTRQFTAEKLMNSLDEDEDILGVSLRMGENITYCYTRNINTTPPDFSQGYRWAWKSASPGYWNYPMSQDGHIFRVSDFAELLPKLNYRNPNTLEANQSGRAFPRPDLVCEQYPCVINIAANRVQSIYKNRCGNISAEFLNTSFLAGLAIDVTNFSAKVFDACHIEEDLPLIDDERSREPPAVEIITKEGKSWYRIDLRNIPVFVLNCPEDKKNRIFQQEQLSELGMSFEFVRCMRVDPGWVGVALGHLKALRLSRAYTPFLVLEDDCKFEEGFQPVLEIPVEAEALYLGNSTFGLPEPGTIGWGKAQKTEWQHYAPGLLRVFNMLARHAVLYLNDDFREAVIDSQLEALTNRNFPHPGDMGLAQLHASHTILAVERNMCRQTNRDATDISLPDDLPQNEVKGRDPEKKKLSGTPAAEQSVAEPDSRRVTNTQPPSTSAPHGLCLVSHKYRFIYFLIAKNASSTLRRELMQARYECAQLKAGEVPPEILASYFKFAFLRDPVSRTASAYQEISMRQEMGDVKIPAHAFADMDEGPERFMSFVDSIEDGFDDGHVLSQFKFIGRISMDFCGRVETLQSDLARIYEKLNLGKCPQLPRRRSRAGRKADHDYARFNVDETSLSASVIERIRSIYGGDIDLIEQYCPSPALQSSGQPRQISSQQRALSLSSASPLAPLELYSQVNQSHSSCLVYCLGNRGFYAELTTVARAMIYAWSKNLQLVLDFKGSAWFRDQGWEGYFESFCSSVDDVSAECIQQTVEFTLTGNKAPFDALRGFMPQTFEFGQTQLEGFQNILAFFTKLIFRPTGDCQRVVDELNQRLNLPAAYDAIHIRRGDKVGDEDVFYPVQAYLDRLQLNHSPETLFVMSDDYRAVVEIREELQKRNLPIRVVSLVERTASGFDVWKLRRGERFIGSDNSSEEAVAQETYTRDQTRRLIAETVIASKAQHFISTWLSNVGRTVWYLSQNPEQCELLAESDLAAHKTMPEPPAPSQSIPELTQLLSGGDLDDDFDVLHIHRGDEGCSLNNAVPALRYLKMISSIPDNRSIVLITDSDRVTYAIRHELKVEGSKARLYVVNQSEQALDTNVRRAAEQSALLKARYFVSNTDNPVGRLAWTLHPNRKWCHLLDPSLHMHKEGATPAMQASLYMVEVQLRDGMLHRLELPADSPLIPELRLAALCQRGLLDIDQPTLIQLPLSGGTAGLAFSTHDLACLRLIPEFSGPPGEIKGRRGEHPTMNVDEGHLGGYIRSRQPEAEKWGMQHGDSATWEPQLWRWMCEELGVKSVVDIGCGEGHAARYFRDAGCQVLGIDGSVQAERDTVIPGAHRRHDYVTGPCILDTTFDAAWCCEFVEHVEERYTQNFLATFASAGKYIFMTSAPPGQKGWHHVNCQPKQYWTHKLQRLGYHRDEGLSAKARELAQGHFAGTGQVFVRDRVGVTPLPPTPTRQFATSSRVLPVNDMEIAVVDGHQYFLFLDIFVHPSRKKITAVLPYYFEDWSLADNGIDVENIKLTVGKNTVRGNYIPHRLDSWEPCALLDFEDPTLAQTLENNSAVTFTIMAGKSSKKFTLSTLPEPAYPVLMSLVIKNENRWIRHFLEYYLNVLDVDHVLVYDNGTHDQAALLDILNPYQAAQQVTYIPWNYRWRNINAPKKMIAQPQQEAHSLNRFANSRWIGFLDVDEFLRVPNSTLPNFLSDFETADIDGLSFGLRWFSYSGALEFDDITDAPLTFLEQGRCPLGRKRQKFMVSPRDMRFLRLHTLEEGGRELQVDDTEIFFHHYCQREYRFKDSLGLNPSRDTYMLQFAEQMALDGPLSTSKQRPVTVEQWVEHISRAIAAAESGRSQLDQPALDVKGMCGTMTRHFYNNLCNFEGCRYLEIGSFEGASTVAATYKNPVTATCIDNFSQFLGKRKNFESNTAQFPSAGSLRMIEVDCFSLDVSKLGVFDVYLYDGPHSYENQYRAIQHFAPVLAPLSVVIIDDWNWPRVQKGTEAALADLNIPVLYKKEIFVKDSDLKDDEKLFSAGSWWNGICIMVLGRAKSG